MSNNAASNVIPMREFETSTPDPQAATFDRLLKECQQLALDRLSQAIATMIDKADEALLTLGNQCTDRDQREIYMKARERFLGSRKTLAAQFQTNYLTEFNRRVRREAKQDAFAKADLSSLELGLVNDDDLEETLKINDMAAKLRRYCEEELNALDQRVGVLIGDANLQGDGNPFSPQAVCSGWKLTCRTLESEMKIRMIFHKLFDDHVMDEVRSIYKDLNALLIQRSILPKIRFGIRRGAGGITRRPGMAPGAGVPGAAEGAGAPMAPGMPIPGAMPMGSGDLDGYGDGYGGEGGEGGDLFGMLQSLMARSATAGMAAGIGMATGAPMVQVPGFPPIMGVPGGDAAGLPQRFLQGAELIGSLTRLQHGDAAALPAGMPGIDMAGLASGKTNVVRELKSQGLGNHVDQTDGVTIDIVAMLFDQIFGDERVPEALKGLIGRLQIPVVKVAVLDKKFFSKKSHPARRMLDTLGEFALGLDPSFDQTSPLYKQIESVIARLLDTFVDDVAVFDQLQSELMAVIQEENKRAELAAKEMARKIAYKERLEVGKAMAQLEIRNRAQTHQLPQLVQKLLADEWMRLLLLTYARHGQDSDAWKTAIETMDHLIWSVDHKPSPEDRRKLAHLLPGLLKRLQTGMQLVGVEEDKRKQFFTRLMRMHTKVMSGASPKPAPVPAPAPLPTLTEAVPTLSEEVVMPEPAMAAAEAAPARTATLDELAAPELPLLDFGLEPVEPARTPTTPRSAPAAEHAVAAPSIPVMAPQPAAAPQPSPDDEDAAPAPLEFSNVTIKNPFGDGEIEVEEISLAELPGFGAAAPSDDVDTDDPHIHAVKKLKTGDWLEFSDNDGQRVQAKLSYVSTLKGTYLFVTRTGENHGEYSLAQLAGELRAGRASALESSPLIERAMSSLVGVLKKSSR
jgi:exonuclease VII small subunit